MQLPYQQIPEYPENYTTGNVISRFIDGLGYRYYWATEGLTEKDLQFSPSEGGRTTLETLEHLYGLAEAIVNAPQNIPNIRPYDIPKMTFDQLRKKTLVSLKKASELFSGKSAEEVSNYGVIFQTKEKQREFPYWNMINGQISDAIYHVGQIVSFRRSAGNPMSPKVNVFTGQTAN
ncbi:DinB family protein [Aquimarina sp. 2304DJ70-9]|uniref:DinB family protein n=1 Tax=Aquimarina penaris TaxID=3231044 RepID=UPI003461ACE0